MNWFAVTCELHRDWRNDIEGLGGLLTGYISEYKDLMASYMAKKTKANKRLNTKHLAIKKQCR